MSKLNCLKNASLKKQYIEKNPEEGIIKNESLSKHEFVDCGNLSKFPYCLVGKINSEFKNERICKSGVGILIGPNIVLTAGHNLTNINRRTEALEIIDSISFNLGMNGDFEPFETITSTEYFIPDDFIEGIKEENAKKQLSNDWAVVYLPIPIGKTLVSLYNLNNFSYLQVRENGLYSYFTDNASQNLSKLAGINSEISIIGYSWIDDNNTTNINKEGNVLTDNKESDTSNIHNNSLYNKANVNYNKLSNRDKNTLDISNDCQETENNNLSYKKKDININIQISTQEEGYVKSHMIENNTTINSVNMKLNSKYPNFNNSNNYKKSLDFVIFNNNSSNRIKEMTTIEQITSSTSGCNDKGKGFNEINNNNNCNSQDSRLFMSESHGRLEDFESSLKYKISTYKGQSGSPIFLKLKKISSNRINNYASSSCPDNPFVENEDVLKTSNKESDYIYIFIGIHSRRGPLLYDSIMMKELDEDNLANIENNENNLNNVYSILHEDEVDKVETISKRLKSMSVTSKSRSLSNNSNEKTNNNNNNNNINNLVLIHGVCDFNEGLLIMGNNVSPICNAIKDSNRNLYSSNNNFDNVCSEKTHNKLGYRNLIDNTNNNNNSNNVNNSSATSYKCVGIYLNSKEIITGLFHKDSKLETLFDFGAAILNVDKSYIILSLLMKKHEKKFNSKYDNTKTLVQILEEEVFSAYFNVEINMKYGDLLGKKVLDKYMENYDVELYEIKNEFKECHMKALYDSIFDEIVIFSDVYPVYGKLFNKIRSYILNKLELN